MRRVYAMLTLWHGYVGEAVTIHLAVGTAILLLGVLSGDLNHPLPIGSTILLFVLGLVDMALGGLRTLSGRRIAAQMVEASSRKSVFLSCGDREELWFRAKSGAPYPLDLRIYCDDSGAVLCECYDPNRQRDDEVYRPWTRRQA